MKKISLGEKVLATIKDKKINHKARWKFLLRDYLVWSLGILSLLVGALAFSAMLYMLRHNEWENYSYFSDSFLRFVVITLPYFWLLFLGIFVFISDYYIKHTKKGYKYRLSLVILGSVFVNIILGTLFYNVGIGETIDDVLGERAPFYREFINPNMRLWNQPEQGLLSGKINKINSQYEFELRDINNKNWIVFHSNSIPMPVLKENIRVNLIGEMVSSDSFRAEIIKPMGAGRGFLNRGMNEMHRNFEENPELLKERIKIIPILIEKNPAMKEIFQDHIQRHQDEINRFFEEKPELLNDLDIKP